MRKILAALGFGFTAISFAACSTTSETTDPHLWLEEVEGEKALEWVKKRSDASLAVLQKDPRFSKLQEEAKKILVAKDRIPSIALRGDWLFNFWQDDKHVKGLWRRVKPAEYEKANPKWEVLLDIDALAQAENESWVWKGSSCLPPKNDRCLIYLSRGGKDATVVREFDVPSKKFVEGGFTLPEAKSRVAWIDSDTLYVGTDFGPGSLTQSGYPRIVKEWKRGTPLAEAKTVFEGKPEDLSVSGYTSFRKESNGRYVSRGLNFYESETFWVSPEGALKKLPFPPDVEFQGNFQGHFLALLRKEWKAGEKTVPAGSVVSLPMDKAFGEAPEAHLEVLFTPSERISSFGVGDTADSLYLSVLDNVRGRIYKVNRVNGAWKSTRVPLPDHGSISFETYSSLHDQIYFEFQSFLVPTTLYRFDPRGEGKLKPIKKLAERFNAKDLMVEQFESTSRDGTKIPYFVVRPKKLKLDGKNATLLYGYGGFENPMMPFYMQVSGKTRVERGGVWVLANIRGGGEFGPSWHQAALKTQRQKAFDDFISVAEDLIARKITSPAKLGIMGGSNGGLLVGAVMTQRPELFGAVVCQVPLLDMMRYHKLLAGHSWVGEYGSPDNAEEREAILKYSPYQNVKAGVKYPTPFILTSTRDDRVHPGHARKMVARMEEQGHPVIYFENTEGGHAAGADLLQRARNYALEYTYLSQRLMDHSTGKLK